MTEQRTLTRRLPLPEGADRCSIDRRPANRSALVGTGERRGREALERRMRQCLFGARLQPTDEQQRQVERLRREVDSRVVQRVCEIGPVAPELLVDKLLRLRGTGCLLEPPPGADEGGEPG